jgi:hypothetical protein
VIHHKLQMTDQPFNSPNLQQPAAHVAYLWSPVSVPFRFRIFLLTLLLAFMVAGTGFGQKNQTQSVDLKGAKSLNAEVQFNAGTLKLTAHSGPKVDSRFTYTRDAWKPEVKFTEQSGQGRLSIRQPKEKNTNMDDDDQNDWEIKLPQGVPTDLKLRMGAGEGTVDLRNARVRSLDMDAGAGKFSVNLANTSVSSLEVNAGVGELSIDLGGSRTAGLQASINGGVGDVKLVLPRKTGVRVKVSGLGGVDTEGLKKQGDYYVNDAYGKTTHSVSITVNGGLGNLELALEK